jgi:hypothetical protein
MQWTVALPGSGPYGPIHLMALLDLVRRNVVPAQAMVWKGAQSNQRPAGEVLLGALVERNTYLERERNELAAERAREGERLRAEVQALRETVEEVRRAAAAAREQAAAAQEAETEARKQAEATSSRLREWESKLAAAEAECRRLRSEQETRFNAAGAPYGAPGGADAGALPREFMESHELLTRHVEEQTQELIDVLESRRTFEHAAEEHVRELERSFNQERQEASSALKRLADLQRSYNQLVRSYREMNERVIFLAKDRRRQPVQRGARAVGTGPRDGEELAPPVTP